jgi:hypothetical protein
VLQDFAKDETDALIETMGRAVNALEAWLTSGVDIMMNRFNGNGQPPPPKPPRVVAPRPETPTPSQRPTAPDRPADDEPVMLSPRPHATPTER